MSDLFDGEDRPTPSADTPDSDPDRTDESTLLPRLLAFPFQRIWTLTVTAASLWLFSWPARALFADSGVPIPVAATPSVLVAGATLFALLVGLGGTLVWWFK